MMQQQMLPYRFLGWLKNNCNEDNPSVTPLVGEIHTDIIRSHRCGVFGKSLWGWELQCADRGCNTGSLGVIRVPALRLSDASCFGRVTLFGVSYTVMCIYSSCTLHFMCWVKLLCYRKEKRKKKTLQKYWREFYKSCMLCSWACETQYLLQVLINSVFIQKET